MLVAMATPFAPLKIQIALYKFTHPEKPAIYVKKMPQFLHGTKVSAILAYFSQIWLPWQLPSQP